MRWGSLFLVVALMVGACGDDDVGATTTTAVASTTTTFALSDPRFPDTMLSAPFALPDTGEFGEGARVAHFFRTADGLLATIVTGLSVPAGEPMLDCGWILLDYGGADVVDASSWYDANFEAYSNQPWATAGATAEPRCEAEFLEEGELRSDIIPAVQCGDYLVIIADQMDIDPSFGDYTVAVPSARLLVDAPDDVVLELEAIPWLAHPGEHPTANDLVAIDDAVLDCSLTA